MASRQAETIAIAFWGLAPEVYFEPRTPGGCRCAFSGRGPTRLESHELPEY